jgi:predicted lipoprotein
LVEAEALVSAIGLWKASEEVADLELAQEAWRAAMAVWQELEVMQIGPAASSLTAVAGEDLRDEIYSWPTVNPCRVDQETVYGGWSEAAFLQENLVNSYGLDAVEHLLFSGPDNVCPSQVDINVEGSWDALGEAGIGSARAGYAQVAAEGVLTTAQTLLDRWQGGFSAELGLASPYDSENHAVNAVFDALFYLETATKDAKLGHPAGLQDCAEAHCADAVENPASGTSLAHIEANLHGYRSLFTGGDGDGIDDLLAELDHEDLSVATLDALDQALADAAVLDDPLGQAIVDRHDDVVALYESVKAVTDLLKGDVATVLSLQIPDEAAGDND